MFIEDFIEEAHQFEVLEERRTSKLRDRSKAFQSHSTNEWIGLNGCVKNRIIEVNDNSKRKRNHSNISLTEKNKERVKEMLSVKIALKRYHYVTWK